VSSKRIGILLGGIALVFCALIARLFHLQFAGEPIQALGIAATTTVVLPATRGAILDRDGRLLRGSRDAFDVQVTASAFREKNLVDALADLVVLLAEAPPSSIERSRLVGELRARGPEAAIERVLALDPRVEGATRADDLKQRAHVLVEPEGTLVRPVIHARRRVMDALVVVAGDRGPRLREIRKRLRDGAGTVGSVAGAGAESLAERIRTEEDLLGRLGGELGIGDAGDVRAALDELCDRHFRRVEAEVERRVDDAICLQHFGSWNLDPADLGAEGMARLRARASAAIRDAGRAATALAAARAVLGGRMPGSVAQGGEGGDPLAAARAGGLADWDVGAIRAALCQEVRKDPAFERSRYLDARKECQTRNELAAFRGDDLGHGGAFALASIVDGPAGLRGLGFELVASFARDDGRKHRGSNLALLLGDVTRRNLPTGGIEERLGEVLGGEPGEARIRASGEVVSVRPPRHGDDLRLTLSMPLQERVEAILDRMGAVAIVDVATGGILCAATWPAPPEGDVRGAIAELADLKTRFASLRGRARAGDAAASSELLPVWDRIVHSPAIHRAVTSETNMPPGSVMKALTLLAGLEAGVIDAGFVIDCTTGDLARFGCHRHGPVDLEGAMERSCNEYCYRTVGLLGGTAALFDLYDRIGLFDEIPGIVGSAAGAWMRNAIQGDDPRNLAIGQGSFSLPPVRLAAVAASIARGRTVRAHLCAPEGFEAIGPVLASDAHLAPIRSGMRKVAVGDHGTARRFRGQLDPLGIAGKTGTAQVRSGEEELYQAWFVGYAPYSAPRYAFAVLIERTSDEGAEAAPIAARVVDACYEVLGGRP
jgi:cell division protein FtsI/penicillin-binding protein 2